MAYQNLGNISWGSGPNITGSVSYDYRRNVSDMQYKIKLTINPVGGGSYFGYPIYADIRLDGAAKASGHTLKNASPSTWSSAIVYETEWLTVSDKTSGSTALVVRVYSGMGESRDYSYSYSLSVSPAASVPSVEKPSVYLGEQVKVFANSKNPNFYHLIGCKIGSYEHWGKQDFDYDGIYNSCYFKPSIELAQYITKSTSGQCTILLKTYSDSTLKQQVGATQSTTVTLHVPESVVPTASLTITPVPGENVPQSWGNVLVKTFGKLSYQVNARGAYGSTIENISFSFAGQNLNGSSGTTDVLMQSGDLRAIVTVRDSRGRITSIKSDPVAVYNYANTTMDQPVLFRCNAYGEQDDNGAYLSIKCSSGCSSIGGRNSVTVSAKTREANGSFGADIPLINGIEKVVGGYSTEKSYFVQFTAVDMLGTENIVTPQPIPTAYWAFKIKEGGKAASFGKAPEEDDMLDIAWSQRIRKNLQLDGDLNLTKKAEWISTAIGETGYIRYCKKSGYVTVVCASFGGHTIRNSYESILALPDGFKPAFDVPFAYNRLGSAESGQGAYVRSNGNIELYSKEVGSYFAFSICFPI